MVKVPFYDLTPQHAPIQEELHGALAGALTVSNFILGEQLEAFEHAYAAYIGVKHCVGVGSGLDALKISLKVLGIGPGDEVLVPANTFIATLMAVTETGATPVMVEPDGITCNINPEEVRVKITPRTKAVIPVHLYGRPAEMDALATIAEENGLWLIEDNAQAAGAVYKGKRTGSLGSINAHSFYPTKNLGALGDGGAITTNDDGWAEQARRLRNYGSAHKYKHECLGYNSRLDELQAAFLRIKLKHLDGWLAEKQKLADRYTNRLSGHPAFSVPLAVPSGQLHGYHLYVIQCAERDDVMAHLREQGIQCLVHYPVPSYRQPAYQASYDPADYPVTEKLSARCLSLPLFPGMTEEQLELVVSALLRF